MLKSVLFICPNPAPFAFRPFVPPGRPVAVASLVATTTVVAARDDRRPPRKRTTTAGTCNACTALDSPPHRSSPRCAARDSARAHGSGRAPPFCRERVHELEPRIDACTIECVRATWFRLERGAEIRDETTTCGRCGDGEAWKNTNRDMTCVRAPCWVD